MYARKLQVTLRAGDRQRNCPLKVLDSFAMRSFTGESRFDDTLPIADGRLEAGSLVPLEPLRAALEDWLRRKCWLEPGESVQFDEVAHG